MGSTLGFQESVKRGEKRPCCHFVPPITRDLDPSSYFPNSFRRDVLGNSATQEEPGWLDPGSWATSSDLCQDRINRLPSGCRRRALLGMRVPRLSGQSAA